MGGPWERGHSLYSRKKRRAIKNDACLVYYLFGARTDVVAYSCNGPTDSFSVEVHIPDVRELLTHGRSPVIPYYSLPDCLLLSYERATRQASSPRHPPRLKPHCTLSTPVCFAHPILPSSLRYLIDNAPDVPEYRMLGAVAMGTGIMGALSEVLILSWKMG